MFPAVATGAPNPEPGLTAAVMMPVVIPSTLSDPRNSVAPDPVVRDPVAPDAVVRDPVAEGLARHMAAAFARCRELGHREARVALTRPTPLAEAIGAALIEAGLSPLIRPARQAGCLTLTLAT